MGFLVRHMPVKRVKWPYAKLANRNKGPLAVDPWRTASARWPQV